MIRVREFVRPTLVHTLVPSGPIPSAQDPDGVYPYVSYCETSRRPSIRNLRFVALENDRLRVEVCPDLGGRVNAIIDRKTGVNVLYTPEPVRPVRILPRGFYIPGGIEVSFPISHTPVQFESVLSRSAEREGRVYCWCGERELRFGMHWTVEYSLGEGEGFLTQRTVFENPTATPRPWMSWSNAGIPCGPETIIDFPNGPVLAHGDVMETIDWATQGPRRQGDVSRMMGYFWREPDVCAFGVFDPVRGCGLYHVADPELTPGIKFWTYGIGKHEEWAAACSPAGNQYLEIQGGPLVDQSIKDQLQPGERRFHVEFWIPTDRRLELREIARPSPELVTVIDVPHFDWARVPEVEPWNRLLSAHARKNIYEIPLPPTGVEPRWAPSGLEDLGEALEWATQVDTDHRNEWLFQWGAWLAGRDEIDEALAALAECDHDLARALAGRLLRRCKGDAAGAAEQFRAIEMPAVALHPQVVVERDLALAELGPEAFEERETSLAAISALPDEWVRERLASLRADQGRFDEAEEILRETEFQLVHQRYARTRLWRRIKRAKGEPEEPIPAWLGEDDLAEFGAYREYAEDAESLTAD